MPSPTVAQIAVDGAAFHFDKLYSYLVPASLGTLCRGCRVLVPFGGGNRKRTGVVVSIGEGPAPQKCKPITAVLDATPLLSEEMMDLALWLKQRTFCTVFDAVKAMLPSGLNMQVKWRYHAVEEAELGDITTEERRAWQLVRSIPDGIEHDKLLTQMGYAKDSDLVDRLVKRGVLKRDESAFRRAGDATMRMVRLTDASGEMPRGLTDKQRTVLETVAQIGQVSVKEVCYFCSVTPAVVSALSKKGLVEVFDAEVLRAPCDYPDVPTPPPITLNAEQQTALEGLREQALSHQAGAALLYGVTGSGKTQVYMRLIDDVLQDGRQVLVMVPEISLTPQTVQLFVGRYGKRVAVLHSGLSVGERMDEWKRIKRGEAAIVVGTRSAVFAPLSNLGLVIMDEEQEHTYKSESTPRYHARDVARYRCAKAGALLLLTSATPSVESFDAARQGRYRLYTLKSRFGEGALPQVDIVDMREQEADGIISEPLRQAMQDCIDAGQQVILLLNRRGFNTHVSCRSCGHVITCPSCSISMTYHRANGQLVCHYCGHMQPRAAVCPECGSDKVRYAGLGTQRVEEELEQLFPGVPILRMDTDTTMSRFAHETKFKQFERGDFPIMIGTQMVAKGLDFPHVGLVGVLSADQSLYGDDFRCFETTFSLLTQVIGRAGRRDVTGRAIIQTHTPENYVIHLAADQDYEGFFETEIAARKAMKYPPYADLCMFGFVGTDEGLVKRAAHAFVQQLHQTATAAYTDVPIIALDPSPAVVAKVSGKFRYKLLIKTVNNARFRAMTADLLTAFAHDRTFSAVTVFADVNPAALI